MRVDGTSNVFAASFGNQCTYWASQRYHDKTGIWVPCTGNAYQWAGEARANGWLVSSTPPVGIPSIICLAPYAQQAGSYGHVAVVEKINSDGSVYTSGYDWYPHEGDSVVVYVTFTAGSGVSFIYASNNSGSLGVVGSAATFVTNAVKSYALGSNATVAAVLADLDDRCQLVNPFDNIAVQKDHFQIDLFGYDTVDLGTYTDPISWLQSVGGNLMGDGVALVLRLLFIIIGTYMLFRVIDHYLHISQMIEQTISTVGKVATL
jgi:surface antigen